MLVVGGAGYVLSAGGGEGTASSTTEPSITASTLATSTAAASTTVADSSRVIASNGFAVSLAGPTEIKLGVQAIWTVDAPGAVNGTWSLNGPVQPDPDTWLPGNYFAGTWNVQGSFDLTLTAVDADGNVASDTLTFTVS
jgi:hypothetical protein